MDGKKRGFRVDRKPFFFALIICALAFSGSTNPLSASAQDRVFEAQFSPNLPIAVVSVRNLQAEHWLRDLEIVIENVSDRPIYLVRIHVRFPDIDAGMGKYAFPLTYGRFELIKEGERVRPEDVPIKPGETHVFTVNKAIWKGFEHFAARENLPEEKTKRIHILPQQILFEDGTGFMHDRPFRVNN